MENQGVSTLEKETAELTLFKVLQQFNCAILGWYKAS